MLTFDEIIEDIQSTILDDIKAVMVETFSKKLIDFNVLFDEIFISIHNRNHDIGGIKEVGRAQELLEGFGIELSVPVLNEFADMSDKEWADSNFASPEEFSQYKGDARIVAKFIETIYHECRHCYSMKLCQDTGKCYRYLYCKETVDKGYWNNRFEVVAYKFQQNCMRTVHRYISAGDFIV